jgi:hypothetical protein
MTKGPDSSLHAFGERWASGDRGDAAVLASEYLDTHPEVDAALHGLPLETVVSLIDGYRAAGREDDLLAADAWLLTHFPPQQIVGALGSEVNNG